MRGDRRRFPYVLCRLRRGRQRFAHLLADAGIGRGDRIATALFNTPEYGIVHFGNARAGSVLVHISPMYAAPESPASWNARAPASW